MLVESDAINPLEGVVARKKSVPDQILSAALTLAATKSWRSISLAEIAAEAGVSLAEAYAAYPTKTAILIGLLAQTDQRVLSEDGIDFQEPARDRLFDVLMRRFDALDPHKPAVRAIIKDLPLDPPSWIVALPNFAVSMAWMLEAAGLSSTGLAGAIRIKGLALIYLNALRIWLNDDTEDMAGTMAAVDRGLRRAESCATSFGTFGWCRPRGRRSSHSEAVASPNGEIAGEI